MDLTLEEGKFLIKIARDSIKKFIKTKKSLELPNSFPDIMKEKRGVFVTLYKGKDRDLRGCIGVPYPTMALINATIKAAISSATEDFRFFPPYGPGRVTEEELKNISVEISVLTKPELIKIKNPRDYLHEIKIGKDGLIIKQGAFSGLLLPQVPIEQNWNNEEYLSYLSQKAGLLPDAWLNGKSEIYKFQAQIFSENTPEGEVNQKDFSYCK